MKYLIIFLLFSQLLFSQKMVTLTIDPSRAVENKDNFDSGIDIELTLIIDTEVLIEPFIKIEYFSNIDFIKSAVGGSYTMYVNKWHFAPSVELGLIHRKKPNLKSWNMFLSPALNFEIRYLITERIGLITNINNQYRTDFKMYGTTPKNVTSVKIGVGYIF